MMVIERYKSGFLPPGDHPFEDLSRTGGASAAGSNGGPARDTPDGRGPDPAAPRRSNPMTARGTVGAGKLKKRVGLFGIFSSNKVRKLQII